MISHEYSSTLAFIHPHLKRAHVRAPTHTHATQDFLL